MQDNQMSVDLYQLSTVVGTRGSMLPPAQAYDADVENTILGDGAFLVVSNQARFAAGE